MNWIAEEGEEQRSDEEDTGDEQYVLGFVGGGSPPFTMGGKINRKKFCLLIDSGSPVTIISRDELQIILQYEVLFVRPLPEDEKYVEFKTSQFTWLHILRNGSGRKIYPKGENFGGATRGQIYCES